MGVGCPNPPVPGAGGCAAVAGAAVGAAAEAAAADVGLPYAPARGFDGFFFLKVSWNIPQYVAC